MSDEVIHCAVSSDEGYIVVVEMSAVFSIQRVFHNWILDTFMTMNTSQWRISLHQYSPLHYNFAGVVEAVHLSVP